MDSHQPVQNQDSQRPLFTLSEADGEPSTQEQSSNASTITMNSNEIPTTNVLGTSHGSWMTPTTQPRQRPATIHEGFSLCLGDDFTTLMQPWDLSPVSWQQQPPSECMSRPVSMHQDLLSPIGIDTYTNYSEDNQLRGKRSYDAYAEMQAQDADMAQGHNFLTEDTIPLLDLKFDGQNGDSNVINFDGLLKPRRMSGSSFTMSTSGALSDMHSHDDYSTALSEAPSFTSDWPTHSNRNSMVSSTALSPVASPRLTPQGRSELVRTQSRGRASPSPRPGVRSVPYSVETARNKRWSTGSYGTAPTRRPAPFMYHGGHDGFAAHHRLSAQTPAPATSHPPASLGFTNFQPLSQNPYFMGNANPMQRSSMYLPSQLPSQIPSQVFGQDGQRFDTPPPLLSHGLLKMLQSNADQGHVHGHYADFADAPDLFAALNEEQLSPPPEDMNPTDPDMAPREQELRFEGDLYTPRWVRGHGNKREGWCGICKPGRWLVLKNSAFWYDKSFSHGVSAATGTPFQEPQGTRRMDGNPDVWEGLCGGCDEWIALVSSKKKGTTWFRHAYKCHTHSKKDGVKRRRESANVRNIAGANSMRPKAEPLAPQTTTPSVFLSGTPSNGHFSRPRSRQETPVPPPQPLRTVNIMPSALFSANSGLGNMI